MATLGNVPAEAYTNTVKDSFSGNGSTTAFTMSLPTVTNDVRVVVENVIQDPTVAYSVSGTTLTFTSAPPSGTNNIYVVHLGPAVMTTVPPAEIADATTFASSLTVQGAFTSKGIDDNADAVALTIDSSENVLVGQTTAGSNTVGTSLRSDGRNFYCADGNYSAHFNRKSSDGAIAHFAKDDTIVGSIGVLNSNNVTISGTVADHGGLQFGTHCVIPMEANADSDGTINLGSADSKFKDAYLSGGVYLGGTGSANKLEDYEEGTWTPSLGGNASYNFQRGFYTKVGRQVTLVFYLDVASIGTGSTSTITGQPFASTTFAPASGVISRFQATAGSYVSASGQIGSSNIVILGKTSASASTSNISPFQNGTAMYMTITYFTS